MWARGKQRPHAYLLFSWRARSYAARWNTEHPHVIAYGWHAVVERRWPFYAVIVKPRRAPVD